MAWNKQTRALGLKVRQTKAEIRDSQIREEKHQRPYLTLHDLASRFGVSHMTVKRALDKQNALHFPDEK